MTISRRDAWTGILASLALVVSPALITSGCSKSGRSSGGTLAGSTAAGSTNGSNPTGSGPSTGTGFTPGGGSVQPGGASADQIPPQIQIDRPVRGQFVQSGSTAISGRVTDSGGSGLASLSLNGRAIPVSAAGTFALNVRCGEGLNVASLRATDQAGNEAVVSRGFHAGRFLKPQDVISEAMVARLEESAFQKLSPHISAALLANKAAISQRLNSFNPIMQQRIGFVNVTADAIGIDYSAAQVGLDPVAGGVNFAVGLRNVRVDQQVTLRALIRLRLRGTMEMDEVRVSGSTQAVLDPNTGAFSFRVTNSSVVTRGFRMDVRGLPSFIDRILAARVKPLVEQTLKQRIEQDIPRDITAAVAAMSQTVRRTILGRDLVITFRPTRLDIDDTGASLALDANVDAAQPTRATANAPGSLVTQGSAPSIAALNGLDFLVAINDDMANRAAFAAWRAGVLNLELDPNSALAGLLARMAAANGSATAPTFDSTLLQTIFPELVGHIPTGAPVVLRVEPNLPPILRMLRNRAPAAVPTTGAPPAAAVEVAFGELIVDIAVDDPATGNRQQVMAVAIQAVVEGGFTFDQKGSIVFAIV